jgi:hypothetical protein
MAVKRIYAADMQSAQTNLRDRQEAGEVILATHQQDFQVGMRTASGFVDCVFSSRLFPHSNYSVPGFSVQRNATAHRLWRMQAGKGNSRIAAYRGES